MIMEKWERAALLLVTIIFTIVSIQGFFFPEHLFQSVEITLESASGLAEIRAAYGGAFGALAFLTFRGARNEGHRLIAIQVVAIVLGGCTVGRGLSLALDGVPNSLSLIMHGVETLGFLISASFLVSRSRAAPQTGEAR